MAVERLSLAGIFRGLRYAVGPSLDFVRKVSLCSALLVGNGGDAQHFQLQVNRSENPATTNKGARNILINGVKNYKAKQN